MKIDAMADVGTAAKAKMLSLFVDGHQCFFVTDPDEHRCKVFAAGRFIMVHSSHRLFDYMHVDMHKFLLMPKLKPFMVIYESRYYRCKDLADSNGAMGHVFDAMLAECKRGNDIIYDDDVVMPAYMSAEELRIKMDLVAV